MAGSMRSEGPTRDALISTSLSAGGNVFVGQFSLTRQLAQFDIDTVEGMVRDEQTGQTRCSTKSVDVSFQRSLDDWPTCGSVPCRTY